MAPLHQRKTMNTPDRRQKRTPQTIEELCAIVLSAAVGKSVYLLFLCIIA